jgi:hypothetical protein
MVQKIVTAELPEVQQPFKLRSVSEIDHVLRVLLTGYRKPDSDSNLLRDETSARSCEE